MGRILPSLRRIFLAPIPQGLRVYLGFARAFALAWPHAKPLRGRSCAEELLMFFIMGARFQG